MPYDVQLQYWAMGQRNLRLRLDANQNCNQPNQ